MAQPTWSNFRVANLQSDLLKWSLPGNRHEQMEQWRCSKSYPSRIKTFRLYGSKTRQIPMDHQWLIPSSEEDPVRTRNGEKKCPESSPSCVRTSIHAWMILDVSGIAGENQQFIRMGFIHGYHGDQPHTKRNAHYLPVPSNWWLKCPLKCSMKWLLESNSCWVNLW